MAPEPIAGVRLLFATAGKRCLNGVRNLLDLGVLIGPTADCSAAGQILRLASLRCNTFPKGATPVGMRDGDANGLAERLWSHCYGVE